MLCLARVAPARITENFDAGWKFLPGDLTGAEQPVFDDANWKTVDLPHDWSIAGPFAETNKTGGAGAFLPGGIVWYRKSFSLPESASGRSVSVEFDGVMQNSDVWINRVHLGHRPNGYVGFRYKLNAPPLVFGRNTTNVLAVRTDTSAQPASRWYSGGGIYRHVRLVVADPIHIDADGVFITTPNVSGREATVQFQIVVTNESAAPLGITVNTALVSPDGKNVATVKSELTVSNHAPGELRQQIVFPKPQLWSPDAPHLYLAVTKIMSGKMVLDETTTTFGIREAIVNITARAAGLKLGSLTVTLAD